LQALPPTRVKIEFQGGEPTLRVDILRRVIAACEHIPEAEFVVCTNLMSITAEIWTLFDDPRVYISTSLDGPSEVHKQNRTENETQTVQFEANFKEVIRRYGANKVSALPTINPKAPPNIDALIDTYLSYGQRQIFLRPINFHGFARKQHRESIELSALWQDYYERFVRRLIERNFANKEHILEETYLSIALRRIFQPGVDRHVDLRSPSGIGRDYVVIDYDGTAYPTDEARMLARSGVIDLSIGDIFSGWDTEERALLDSHASNQFDPDCQRCTYQPYCGRDVVDDLARYGRIDLPRLETTFCKRHQSHFDFIFKLLYDDSETVRYSLARWLRIPGDFAAQEVWL
jgi:radical SAM protein with 4Fe4S-binding SPASM domain